MDREDGQHQGRGWIARRRPTTEAVRQRTCGLAPRIEVAFETLEQHPCLRRAEAICRLAVVLMSCMAFHLVIGMPQCFAQDVTNPQHVFSDDDSDTAGVSFLSTGFDDRLPPAPKSDIFHDESNSSFDLQGNDLRLSNYLDAPEKTPSSLTADLMKRLADVEKRLAKRDEADAKKASEFPTYKITGFLQFDTGYYDQSPKNVATVGNGQDGTEIRRARFAVNGKVAEFTSYQMEVDFASAGRPSFFDNYVEQGNLPILGEVRVGQFLQPFSVDAMSGFRNLAFLERSLPFLAFVPFRRVGIMASNASEDDLTHWAYSVFRTGGFNNAPMGDSRFGTDFGDIGGYSFSTRITHLLYYDEFAEDRYLWHIGLSYDFSELGANTAAGAGTPGNAGSPVPFYQARTTPEFGPLGYPELSSTFGTAENSTPIFVDTGKYQANNFNLFGLETVYQYGPVSIQAEYMGTVVQSVVGPVFYQGGYAEAMYRLTGEHRGYDKKLGSLKNPIPFADFIPLKWDGIRGWGAWSVNARWSVVDLTNPAKLDGHYVAGTTKAGNGVLNDVTLGMNWYLNAHTKVQFNWIHAMLDNTAKGSSTAELFVSRVQVDF